VFILRFGFAGVGDYQKIRCDSVRKGAGNMNDCTLQMKGISKKFPGTQALSGVDFDLKKGEIHALIGENGAGKSTLMNILMGVHQLDEGEIFLNQEKIEPKSPHDMLIKGIGMVPQELNLEPELSVAENIYLGNEQISGKIINWKTTAKKAKKAIEKLGVDIDVNQRLGNISAAYQQLVSIVRSLEAGSNILILDEPTAALMVSESEQLFRVMRQLKDEGKSMILITHHLEEVKEISDRVTVMRDGKKICTQPTEEISIDQMIYFMANQEVEKSTRVKRNVGTDVFFEVKDFSRDGEFKNISFEVYKGEIFGLAGLVGAGRTELINAIYGLTKKKTGQTFIENKEIDIKNPYTAIRNGIGYVPEERRKCGIFPVLSIYENMLLPSYYKLLKYAVIPFGRVKKIADENIIDLGIKTPGNDVQIKSLSGGNQQKVILARWMAKNVNLLILDEPTRGIDVRAKGEIYKLIRQLADKGMTVVVVSSEIQELLVLADRIMIMHEGVMTATVDNTDRLESEDILKFAYQ